MSHWYYIYYLNWCRMSFISSMKDSKVVTRKCTLAAQMRLKTMQEAWKKRWEIRKSWVRVLFSGIALRFWVECDSVDGSEITHQLRLVVYPIIYRIFYIPCQWFSPSTVCDVCVSFIYPIYPKINDIIDSKHPSNDVHIQLKIKVEEQVLDCLDVTGTIRRTPGMLSRFGVCSQEFPEGKIFPKYRNHRT